MVLAFVLSGAIPVAAADAGNRVKEEIIYKILVDRFNNGDFNNDEEVDIGNPNAFHGGDIKGIIAKLDGLQEIGASVLSLSSLMENADNGFHGYWTEDFMGMDPQYGSFEDLNQLIDEAHKRDMKVVMEFLPGYIASSSQLIQEPENSGWAAPHGLTEPSWITETLELDLENPEVREYLLGAADFWMEETDLDGFSIQGADQIDTDFLNAFTAHIKNRDDSFYLFGEQVGQGDEQALVDAGLEAVENKGLRSVINDAFSQADTDLLPLYEAWEESGNDASILSIDEFSGKRFTETFSENKRNSLTAWSLALTYLYTAPGVPSIIQGSELPMYGGNAEESQRIVPFNSGDSEVKEFHNRISSLRSQFPALQHGSFELVESKGSMIVFKRTLEDQTMYIALNNGSESEYIDVTGIAEGMQLKGYLGDNLVRENENGSYRIGLPRETAEVYEVQEDTGLNWIFIGFILSVFIAFIGGIIAVSIKQKKMNKK